LFVVSIEKKNKQKHNEAIRDRIWQKTAQNDWRDVGRLKLQCTVIAIATFSSFYRAACNADAVQ